MNLTQLLACLAGSIVIGLVVFWALRTITDWDRVIALDESDPEQVDQGGR